MELKYSLTFNDFLQYQLFTASKSQRIQTQIRKNLVIIYVSLVVLGFLFYDKQEPISNVAVFIVLGIFAIFYPFYLKRKYYRHYKKNIEENAKNKVNIACSLKFSQDTIESIDETGEAKINHSNLEEINETGAYIFLKLKTSESIIFPKSKIPDLEDLKQTLDGLAEKCQLKKNSYPDWKW